jgi:Protein of unknown function (DUF3160)
MTRMRCRLTLLLCFVAVASSCGGSSYASQAAPSPGPALRLPAPIVPFGAYAPVPLVGPDTPAYQGPSTPTSLQNVDLAPSEQAELKAVPALAQLLEKQGFGVVRSGSSLFQTEYEGNIYGGFPVYVTTDAAYNSWHLVFDKTLRDLEQKVLLPKLAQLVPLLLRNSGAGPVHQLFEVAAAELGQKVTLGTLARREKALIDAHSGSQISPITGGKVDYSFFTPRGHYALTTDLRRFFLAMSVLGQEPFCLPGTLGCPDLGPARLGIQAALAVASDPRALALWHAIYDPTAFLVGLSDDYTPGEVAAAVKKAGVRSGSLSAAAVRKVVAALAAARKVRIDPQRASIRVMGTRFVTDEFLLDQLVYPHVGTASKPRLAPSAVDLASSFGSKFAATVMAGEGAPKYENYDSQIDANRQAVASRPPQQWGSTVYDAWLYALQPMFAPHGKAFPDYMRSDAWAAKDLQSGLGSYTELKHDTILFAKQLVAEAGGDFSKRNPLNWVEPDPVAFERLAAGADLLRRGLARRGLLTNEAGGLLRTEIGMLRFLGATARVELTGKSISPAVDKRLRSIGDALSAIWWRTSERSNPNPSIPDQSAVVADIASSPKGVLQIATGEVDTLYVIVPGRNGTFELARGGVYSYYEFTSPPGVRLTDQAWRALLASGHAPARPSWESVLLAPCPKRGEKCSPSFMPG